MRLVFPSFDRPPAFRIRSAILTLLLCVTSATAGEPEWRRIEVDPSAITLTRDAGTQVLVTALLSDGERRNVTRAAEWTVADPSISHVNRGWITAREDGTTELRVGVRDTAGRFHTAAATVTVTGMNESPPIRFTRDVIPLLSKSGCNSGTCHGRAIGQGGFRLSLYGFDSAADYDALVHEGLGRRIAPAAPTESLILRKATGQMPHGGGVRFTPDSETYRRLCDWMEQGVPVDPDDSPRETRLIVVPDQTRVTGPSRHQLRVLVEDSAGNRRDVTRLARYDTQQPDRLAVDLEGGFETTGHNGEADVMIRYQNLVAVAHVIIPPDTVPPEAAYTSFEPVHFIDELVLKKWRQLRITPSESGTDAQFQRRVFLAVLGTLPTPDEVRAFLADTNPNKRQDLVNQVLQREEHVDWWAHRLGDLLRNRVGDSNAKDDTIAFARWIRQSVAGNKPYDQFVREILGGTGKRSDHPQLDWYRWANTPENRVEDTAQAFLGLRMSCANCHNHPFENVSQSDYWQFGAFFARVKPVGDGRIEELKLNDEGELKHPRTGRVLIPRVLGGPEMPYSKGEDPRQKLVDWIVSPENPYFARAFCNRVWGDLFGIGIVDPVDDLRATNPPSNPELLDALAADFVAHKYDMKHLLRTILTSRTFGLTSTPNETNRSDSRNYARYYARRLQPHVLLDAITSATGTELKFDDYPDVKRAIQLPNEKARSDFLEVFGRSERTTSCECETRLAPNLPQVLFLLNSEELQRKIADAKGTAARLAESDQSAEQIVDDLFLRTVSRFPESQERQEALALLEQAPKRRLIIEDLLWTLLNSNEFLFNH